MKYEKLFLILVMTEKKSIILLYKTSIIILLSLVVVMEDNVSWNLNRRKKNYISFPLILFLFPKFFKL